VTSGYVGDRGIGEQERTGWRSRPWYYYFSMSLAGMRRLTLAAASGAVPLSQDVD